MKINEMTISEMYISKFDVGVLFEAWVSPKMAIPPVVKIEVDPQVGGYYILHAESDTDIFIMKGEFLEFIQNEILKYTWSWEGTDEKTIVTVEFSSENGLTNISIQHTGFLTDESKENHLSGWNSYVNMLEKKIESIQNK